MSRIPPEPIYPGHPDDWTDEQWVSYKAWLHRVAAEYDRVHELSLRIATRYAAWAERIEFRRPNWLSRFLRKQQAKNLAIAAEYDRRAS